MGGHLKVSSRGLIRPDFILYKEDCFGYYEKHGREGRKIGSGNPIRRGLQAGAGRAGLMRKAGAQPAQNT